MFGGTYRVDIAVGKNVYVEYEGEHHDAIDGKKVDRPRFNRLGDLPGKTLRYDSSNLRRLDLLVAEVRAALVRHG